MRRLLFTFLFASALFASFPREAAAQYAGGYAFTGVGGRDTPLAQVGGGIERVFANGAGVSFDAGVMTNGDRFRRLTHGSVTGLYHFGKNGGRLDPFVLGGVGLLADWDMPVTAIALGGGVTYWAKLRVGLRVEVRDQVALANGPVHFPGLRVGIALR